MTENLIRQLSTYIPILTGLAALVSAFIFLGRGTVRIGSFSLDFAKNTADNIARQFSEDVARGTSPQNALMREYHAQDLSQSKISFWFSLVFASFGFSIIALSVGLFLQGNQNPSGGWLETAGKPAFTLVAGTVIDAVAALFFVQSNKARQLMVEFFDKLRVDRKLDEALALISKIEDKSISGRVRGIIAMNFSEAPLDQNILKAMFLNDVFNKPNIISDPVPKIASPSGVENAVQTTGEPNQAQAPSAIPDEMASTRNSVVIERTKSWIPHNRFGAVRSSP
jgi:hypothetical protein